MTTGGGGSPPSGPFRGSIGRVRGLRQGGGGKTKVKVKVAKSPPLGSGDRFKNLVGQLSHKPGTTDPKRLAAFIGQRKHGASKMSQMATKNRKG